MKWNELLRNVSKVTPGYNSSTSNRISHFDLNYNPNTKIITFSGEIQSSKGTHGYEILVTFHGINPTDGLTEEEMMQGYMPKPTLADDDIQVRCGCPSYRFRFDKANQINSASTGKGFKPYHRISDRAPNNPHDLPGICYHIIEFVDYLQSQGFVH